MVRTVDSDELERHVIVLVDDNLARHPHVDRHFPATGLIGLVQNIAGTGRQRIGRERLLIDRHAAFHLHGCNRKGTFFGLRLSGCERCCREAISIAATAAVMIFFDIGFSSLLLLLTLPPKKKSIRGRGTAAPPSGGRWTAGGDDRHRTADQMAVSSGRRRP